MYIIWGLFIFIVGIIWMIILEKDEEKKEKDESEAKYKDFVRKNGVPEIRVPLYTYYENHNCLENVIYIYESTKKIFIKGKEYSFEDILSVSLLEEGRFTTKSKNTISRGLVGGAIAGPAGAVIGGTTGRKDTKTIYDYTVCITVKDLQNPTITFNFYNNSIELANKLVGLINNIIDINKK